MSSHQFLVDRLGPGSVGEQGELVEAPLGVDGGDSGQLDTDQEGSLYGDFEIGDGRGEATTASGGVFLSHGVGAGKWRSWRLRAADAGEFS